MTASSIYRRPEYLDAVAALRAWCASNGLQQRCLILCGYPKSGNTLIRFVYHHLIRWTNGEATETLTYTALNAANPNNDFPDGLVSKGFTAQERLSHLLHRPSN